MISYVCLSYFIHDVSLLLTRSEGKKSSPARSHSSMSVLSRTSSQQGSVQHPPEGVKLAWEEESVSTPDGVVQSNGAHRPGTR